MTLDSDLGTKLFPQAKDDETLWRYMSFDKLKWIIENEKLYQPNIVSFEDPFEGTFPKNALADFENNFKNWLLKWYGEPMSPSTKNYYETELTDTAKKRELLRKTVYASCWSLRESKSEALWKLYCDQHDGIVIKTKYGKLKKQTLGKYNSIGKIQYIDYRTDTFEYSHTVSPFMYKRKPFDFESEVRIVTGFELYDEIDEPFPIHMVINISAEDLIDEIRVYPFSTIEYFDKVHSLIKNYSVKLSKKIIMSELSDLPLY